MSEEPGPMVWVTSANGRHLGVPVKATLAQVTTVVNLLADCLIDMTEFGESYSSSAAEDAAGPVLVAAYTLLGSIDATASPALSEAVEHFVNRRTVTVEELRARQAARSPRKDQP